MISEALGTQLAEITDRVLSHWLPTSQSEAEPRGGESERKREGGSGVCVCVCVCVCRPGGRHLLLPPLTVRGSLSGTQTVPRAAAMEELFET